MGCPQSKPKNEISLQQLLPAPDFNDSPQFNANKQTPRTISQPISQNQNIQQPQQAQPIPTQPPVQPASQPAEPRVVGIRDNEADAFKLILCGAGESGKTTFIRQLKIKFIGGINKEERLSFVQTIRSNMIEAMQQLIFWAEHHNLEVSSEFEEDVSNLCELNAFDCKFTPELAEKLKLLFEDPVIQEAYQHRDETIIPDHMDYFYSKIDELEQDDYIPSDDDVLRARIRSIGIIPVTLYLDDVLIRIYDVGGQYNERCKWNKIIDEVEGVIFCVSLAEYDKPCYENNALLRINDSLEIFREITHRPKFQTAPFFLICNKYDMFQEKVKNTDSFLKIFPDYLGDPHDPKECQDYIVSKFIEVSNPQNPNRPIKIFTQSSLDSDQVIENTNKICKYINENYYREASDE